MFSKNRKQTDVLSIEFHIEIHNCKNCHIKYKMNTTNIFFSFHRLLVLITLVVYNLHTKNKHLCEVIMIPTTTTNTNT